MTVTLDAIAAAAGAERLAVFGAFHPGPDDMADGAGTIVLLGPDEPGFWTHVTAAPEFAGAAPHPLDRWSVRVIGTLAGRFGARAVFPFAGSPPAPFIRWAVASGRAWVAPVGLLVHDVAGLLVSYRGALALPDRLDLPPVPDAPPCAGCAAPCLTACPVGALGPQGYDLPACHAFLDTAPGADCMDRGCAVRRACPVSASYARAPAQSAHHMRSFHPR